MATVAADGTGYRDLTAEARRSGSSSVNPVFSPDGTRIMFSRYGCSGDAGTYVMAADGSGARRLELMPAGASSAVFSPDGRRIAFVAPGSDPSGPATGGIWTIGTDGSDLRRITDDGRQPDWSPDGRRIAFAAVSRSDEPDARDSDVFVVDADGGPPHQLTRSARAVDPAFSPDGRRIAFGRPARGYSGEQDSELWTMAADGGDRRRVLGPSTEDRHLRHIGPDWQPLRSHGPDCSGATASPRTLRPVDGRLHRVVVGAVGDPDGDRVRLRITRVSSEKPLRRGLVRFSSRPDQVWLRAERRPGGDGRVYRISFAAGDGHGHRCRGTVRVQVPPRARR